MIRSASPEDVPFITDIYNYYISESIATFEEKVVTESQMAQRIANVTDAGLPWIVAQQQEREQQTIIGYAYASPFKSRSAYRFSIEVSVYLSPKLTRSTRGSKNGSGWGTKLYTDLFEKVKALPVHSIIGGISLPNAASVALHEKMGMQQVAHFKEVGFKFNQWIDVGYWQLVLSDSEVKPSHSIE